MWKPAGVWWLLAVVCCFAACDDADDDDDGGADDDQTAGDDDDNNNDTGADDDDNDNDNNGDNDDEACVPSVLAADGFESYPPHSTPGSPWALTDHARITTLRHAGGAKGLWFQSGDLFPPHWWFDIGTYPWPVSLCPVVWFEVKARLWTDQDGLSLAITDGVLIWPIVELTAASSCFATSAWKKYSARFDFAAGAVTEYCDDLPVNQQSLPAGAQLGALQFTAEGMIHPGGVDSPGVVIDDFVVFDEAAE